MPQAFSRPLRAGQSEMRSPPSIMRSDSNVGLTMEPLSRLSREKATGPLISPFLMSWLMARANFLRWPKPM